MVSDTIAGNLLPSAPVERLQVWLAEAAEHPEIKEPTAMALATASADAMPSVRIVLLKEWDARGATFFTNNESQKGRELIENPQASLCFHWMPLQRQVRLSGKVVQVTAEESDAYFASRSRGSQIGAWASLQSRPLESREILVDRIAAVEARYEGREVPRPAYWGGWRLMPQRIEFWQEREFRLHEREVHYRDPLSGQWQHQWLNP